MLSSGQYVWLYTATLRLHAALKYDKDEASKELKKEL
jgi:hypothetical protein